MSVTREARSGQDGMRRACGVQRSRARPPALSLPAGWRPWLTAGGSPFSRLFTQGSSTVPQMRFSWGKSVASDAAAGANRAQAPGPAAGAQSRCQPPPGKAQTPEAPGLPLLLRVGLVLSDPVLCDSVGSCGAPHGQDADRPSQQVPPVAPAVAPSPSQAPTFCSPFPSFCRFTNVLQMEPHSDPATA